MSTRRVIIKKKVDGDLLTILPSTESSLVQVGTNTLDTELNDIKSSIIANVPIGTIIIWIGTNYPDGWLSLEGQAISRTTYSELFSIYGTTFGAGNGSTTFNLPNQNASTDGSTDSSSYRYIVKALSILTTTGASAGSLSKSVGFDDSEKIVLSLPVGTLIDYAGGYVPDDYMITDGSELLKSEYSELYSVIGNTFNVDDTDDDHFCLPTVEDTSNNVTKLIKISTAKDEAANSKIQELMNRVSALEETLGNI